MYNTYLRELLVKSNVDEFVRFILRFSLPKLPADTWLLTSYPLIIVYLKVNTTYKRKKDKKHKKDDKKKGEANEEADDDKVKNTRLANRFDLLNFY
jgi:dynein heavy chain, axonemal